MADRSRRLTAISSAYSETLSSVVRPPDVIGTPRGYHESEDYTVSDESHILIAQAIFRRAITCFRGSTYQHGGYTHDFILARL